jgi:hypothetical protein
MSILEQGWQKERRREPEGSRKEAVKELQGREGSQDGDGSMKLKEQLTKGFGTGGRAEVEHETVGTANKTRRHRWQERQFR